MWLKFVIPTLGRLRRENDHESKCQYVPGQAEHGETLSGGGVGEVEIISSQQSKNRILRVKNK